MLSTISTLFTYVHIKVSSIYMPYNWTDEISMLLHGFVVVTWVYFSYYVYIFG